MTTKPCRLEGCAGFVGPRLPNWHNDSDVLLLGALLWIASVARVVAALVRQEVFATEATLALAVVVALPWLLFRRQLLRARAARGSARKSSANVIDRARHE